MGIVIGVVVTVVLIAVAIVIAGPYAVEMGVRRALPDHLLRPEGPLESPSEPVACLECGAELKAGDAVCWKCGWSYAR